MGGQNLGQQFAFPRHHKALVLERVAAAFLNEPGDIRIVEEKLIEPGDLRKHLQVGEVLRPRNIFRRASGVAPALRKRSHNSR